MIKLLGNLGSPYVHKVSATLKAKEIPFEQQDVDVHDKPDWFAKLVPFGKVPAIVLDTGEVIAESSVICHFLAENYTSGAKLYADDKMGKIKTQYIASTVDNSIREIGAMFYAKSLQSVEHAQINLTNQMATLAITMEGSEFFYPSNKLSLVDICYSVLLVRLKEFEKITGKQFFSQHPKLVKWCDNLIQQPWLKDTLIPNYQESLKARYEDAMAKISN